MFRRFPDLWKNYFVMEPVFAGWRWLHEWRFRWPQLFELRIVPHIVYEMRVCDPDGESRLAEIDAIFNDPKYDGKLGKLLGSRHWSSGKQRQKELDALALKRIRAALEGDVEAEKTTAKLASSPPQHFPCFRSSTDRVPCF